MKNNDESETTTMMNELLAKLLEDAAIKAEDEGNDAAANCYRISAKSLREANFATVTVGLAIIADRSFVAETKRAAQLALNLINSAVALY